MRAARIPQSLFSCCYLAVRRCAVRRLPDFARSTLVTEQILSAIARKYMSPYHTGTEPTLLVRQHPAAHNVFTYHRTWETGVGFGHEGRRIQPFIIFFCRLFSSSYRGFPPI